MSRSKSSYLKIVAVVQIVCGLVVTALGSYGFVSHTLNTPVALVLGPILLVVGGLQLVYLKGKPS